MRKSVFRVKHTTEYPRKSIDEMVAVLRAMGATSAISMPGSPALGLSDAGRHDVPYAAGRDAGGLSSLRITEASAFDSRRLNQMTRQKPGDNSDRERLTICLPHHGNHAWFSYAASPFADDGEPVALAVLDGTGDLGSISLYAVENGAMRELYSNESMFDSLGMFYTVISSTQGGWTWLSSEGRYMGAAAWGDMNRASNPYYARLKQVLHLGGNGGSAQSRDGELGVDPPTARAGADRDPRRAISRSTESGCGAACRGHHAPPRYKGSPRQGGGDPTGAGRRDDPHRRPFLRTTGAYWLVLTGGVELNAIATCGCSNGRSL
jgi:carbamoyltransferase